MQMHMPLFANYFIFATILLYFQDISSTILLFFTFHSAYLLGCWISFPASKSERVSSLAGKIVFLSGFLWTIDSFSLFLVFLTLIEAIVFGPFS